MPQIEAARKALRHAERRRVINNRLRRQLHDVVRTVVDAINSANKKTAEKAFVEASSVLDQAAHKHIIHPNKAARKKSRLQKAISKLSAK